MRNCALYKPAEIFALSLLYGWFAYFRRAVLSSPVKKRLIQFLKIVLPLAVGVYLVVHIYQQLADDERKALFSAIRNANYFWVALSFLMGVLSHYIRGYRWGFQLEAMGYKVSGVNNFLAVMIGYIVNMVLPRVGEVSRAAAITQYEKVPFEKSFGSIISERAVDFVLLLTISGITLALQYSALEPFLNELLSVYSSTFTSIILWVLIAAGLVGAFVFFKLLDRFRDRPFFNPIWKLKEGLIEGLRSIFRMKARVSYLIATLMIWALYLGMFWICFYALEDTSTLGADAIFASFVVGSFAIVIIPGGIGAFPVGIMQVLLLYGVAASSGFALGWILWLSQTSMIVLVGGMSMILMPIYNRNKILAHEKA